MELDAEPAYVFAFALTDAELQALLDERCGIGRHR